MGEYFDTISKIAAFVLPLLTFAVTWGMVRSDVKAIRRDIEEGKKELIRLKAELEKDLSEHKLTNEKEFDTLKNDFVTSIASIKRDFEKELEQHKSTTTTEIDRIYSKIDNISKTQTDMASKVSEIGAQVQFLVNQFN